MFAESSKPLHRLRRSSGSSRAASAETLFEPADRDDLIDFPPALDPDVAGDGARAWVQPDRPRWRGARRGRPTRQGVRQGRGARRCHAEAAAAGRRGYWCHRPRAMRGSRAWSFCASIPGTVGGFVRMNGGAYGREVKDILVDAMSCSARASWSTMAADELGYTYRHSELPEQAIVVAATFRGHARRARGDRGRDGPHRRSARGIAAAAQPHRRIDLQESARSQGVGADRCRRLPRTDAWRRASVGKALQFPSQPR